MSDVRPGLWRVCGKDFDNAKEAGEYAFSFAEDHGTDVTIFRRYHVFTPEGKEISSCLSKELVVGPKPRKV